MNQRLKILISAYACEPGRGSEPGVGWNISREMARHHDIWVLVRADHRAAIEEEMQRKPINGLYFQYYELPKWAQLWTRGRLGLQLHYYLWQYGVFSTARRLQREVGFDLVHHLTFVRYWSPSLIALLDVPFVWGPVGGGESAPKAFLEGFSRQGRYFERIRDLVRWLGEHDLFVRLTARRSRVALATTKDTAVRLLAVGARPVHTLSQVGVGRQELEEMVRISADGSAVPRFVSIGNLLHWKGFHLGLRAFAAVGRQDTEYWVIGDGPERKSLESLARSLGIANRVTFWGQLPRQDTLRKLAQCSVLIHPSLHDSGGFVCLEAMAAGKPVVCLDLGGPAVQVTTETGFKVAPLNPEQAVRDLAEVMQRLAKDEDLRQRMGAAGQRRVSEEFSWERKGHELNRYYEQAIRSRA